MKYAADFRQQARDALKGNWPVAILASFLASLMGGQIVTASYGSGSSGNSSTTLEQTYNKLQSMEVWRILCVLFVFLAIIAVIWAIVMLFISGAAQLGYATFNLNLIDNNIANVSDLFSQFHRFWDGFCMNFLRGLYLLLWTLLFIIPGIIKNYSYAMAPYILAENPGMTATQSIDESRRIMDGNKWRLFCLHFSFIGWDMLVSVPGIIAITLFTNAIIFNGNIIVALLMTIPCSALSFVGSLFLNPYKEASNAAFYREITRPATEVLTGFVPENPQTPIA